MKKIVVGTVSDREGSNSVYASEVFCELAAQSGYEVERLDFTKAQMEFYSDMREMGNQLFPDDDFIPFLEKILNADAFVIFSPVYWSFYPAKFKLFLDRFSEAMRRKELNFTERMSGKPWATVFVSAGDPSLYQEALWQLNESICRYPFINATPIRGPWFVANKSNELRDKQAELVRQKLSQLLNELIAVESR